MMKPFRVFVLAGLFAFLPTSNGASVFAIAAEQIDLNGHNLLCDSFHSGDTNRSTDGQYDPAKAGDGAYVGLINGIVSSSSVGNADIWGYLETQVPFTIDVGPQSSIGSTAWHLAGMTGIEPGHHTTNFSLVLPDPVPPFAALVPVGGTVDGVAYTYILTPGDYELDELVLTGNEKMLVVGNARLHVRGKVKLSGNAAIRIEPTAGLVLYVGGETANLSGSGVINLGDEGAFRYLGLVGNTSLTLKMGSLPGLIYAPHAACTITSPGGSTAELAGAIYVKSVSLNADFRVHFDEALNP
jgi:hypothetical protein